MRPAATAQEEAEATQEAARILSEASAKGYAGEFLRAYLTGCLTHHLDNAAWAVRGGFNPVLPVLISEKLAATVSASYNPRSVTE